MITISTKVCGVAIFALFLCLGAPAFSAQIGLEVTAMDASDTGILVPGVGLSGTMTITRSPGSAPVGYLDQGTGEGVLYWPVSIGAPLFDTLGIGTLDMVSVGPYVGSELDSCLICFDMGYINHHAQTVHFTYDLLTQIGQAAMFPRGDIFSVVR